MYLIPSTFFENLLWHSGSYSAVKKNMSWGLCLLPEAYEGTQGNDACAKFTLRWKQPAKVIFRFNLSTLQSIKLSGNKPHVGPVGPYQHLHDSNIYLHFRDACVVLADHKRPLSGPRSKGLLLSLHCNERPGGGSGGAHHRVHQKEQHSLHSAAQGTWAAGQACEKEGLFADFSKYQCDTYIYIYIFVTLASTASYALR